MKVSLLELKEKDPAGYGLTRASLIQKLIRRSMTPEAMWVVQLFINDGHQKGLKKRLLQIAVEDIGLCYPQAIEFIIKEENLFKSTALLCSLSKNREVDRFLLNVTYNPAKFSNADEQTNREVLVLSHLIQLSNNWFNDKRNKVKLKDFNEAIKYLSNYSEHYKEIILLAGDIYLDLTRSNIHGARVLLALIALLATRKINKIENIDNVIIPDQKSCNEVPDFALDMHTPFGKILNRGFDHWVEEGAFVYPEHKYTELYDSSQQEKYPLKPLIPFLKKLKK